jgi:uncharacterized protein
VTGASPPAGHEPLRLTVRVQPGASRAKVGGRYGGDDPPVLVVKVAAKPVDGKANEAVRSALAEAFGLKPAAVVLKVGGSSRLKVFEVDGGDPARLAELLAR